MAAIYSDRGAMYRKQRMLGKGTFGVVYLVNDFKGREFVIKTVSGLSSQAARTEAKREADILRLSEVNRGHPNVIRYHDSFFKGNDLCILMEYAPNGNLAEYLNYHRRNGTRIEELDVTHKLRQLLDATRYCHMTLRVIHRDIKPANVLIDRYGTLKLTDFGISKQIRDINMLCNTQAGTPLYMPPEMWSGKKHTYKADMWMLGLVLYEMMALTMPWDTAGILMDALAERIRTHPIRTEHLRARYSRDLCRVVLWMLDRDPSRRPTTEEAMALFEMRAPPSEAASDVYFTAAAARIQRSFRRSRGGNAGGALPSLAAACAPPAPPEPPPPRVAAPVVDAAFVDAAPFDKVTAVHYDVDRPAVQPDKGRPAAEPRAEARPLVHGVAVPLAERSAKHIQAAMRRSLNRRRVPRRPPAAMPPADPKPPPAAADPLPYPKLAPRQRPQSAWSRATPRRIDELAQPRLPRTPSAAAAPVARRPVTPRGAAPRPWAW